MKRALAERAKQSSGSGSPEAAAPRARKIQRSSSPEAPVSSLSAVPPPQPQPAASSLTVSHKRQRPNLKVDESASAFYLQHQNRALAVEWRSLDHERQRLLEERAQRRQECWKATQALHSLQATWTQLETALAIPPALSSSSPPTLTSTDIPSTGTDSVEWTASLTSALATLGTVEDSASADLIAGNLASRAAVLQEHLWKVLQQASLAEPALDVATLRRQLAEAQGQVQLLQHELQELRHARQEAANSERKVRRNVYRLAADMITVEQLVQAMEDERFADLEQEVQRQAAAQAAAPAPMEHEDEKKEAVSSAQVQALQDRLADLNQAAVNRQASLEELTQQLTEKEAIITRLSVKARTAEDEQRLAEYEAQSRRLAAVELHVAELQAKLAQTREEWAKAKGNEAQARATLEEQHAKFCKRWKELGMAMLPEEHTAAGEGDHDDDGGDGDDDKEAGEIDLVQAEQEAQAKEIVKLQHKLSQALENVRQAESTRRDLQVALEMNESLQAKLEELKGKYNALRAEAPPQQQQPPAAKPEGSPTPNNHEGSGADKEKSNHDANAEKFEKMHRENRRMRKEMSAVIASKEAAKAKIERAEKERDSLMESNVRLLKQMTEKDDMNAKSLSTILHLKSMTEQLTLERDNLEQQAKSASQLALNARLATNAKERLSDEIVKEKQALETQIEGLENKLVAAKQELERITKEWSEASGATTTLKAELANALKRSDDLVQELAKKNEEIRDLVDQVSKAQREAREANEKLHVQSKQSSVGGTASGATSNFTVDQLNTQIAVLKNRLACPVCHYRDKECIIMRCRHMHCRQCVNERITNRSRKCPTCNVKFSDKDIEDIWLSG